MKDYVIDVLMNIGVPAGIKGFTYICDAIELFNTDPYYPDGKISALYIDIAKKYHTTPSRVERSIRHAFDIALTKGDPDMVSRYLDLTNRQNSTLLRTLYLRIGQERRESKRCQKLLFSTTPPSASRIGNLPVFPALPLYPAENLPPVYPPTDGSKSTLNCR